MNDAHPDLAALLRGELVNADSREVAEHARSCERCRQDLVDVSLGHGLLTSAARTLGPAADARRRLVPGDPGAASAPQGLPPELRRALGRRRWSRPLVAAAAAAVLLVVGLGAGVVLAGRDAGAPVAVQQARLEPVQGRASGEVSMSNDGARFTRMRINTHDLPRAPQGGFYYVWLLDPATNKMLPLGQVVPGHTATFVVPEPLVAAYSAVDVSLQSDDGNPAHSVTSVLRASYDPALTGEAHPS